MNIEIKERFMEAWEKHFPGSAQLSSLFPLLHQTEPSPWGVRTIGSEMARAEGKNLEKRLYGCNYIPGCALRRTRTLTLFISIANDTQPEAGRLKISSDFFCEVVPMFVRVKNMKATFVVYKAKRSARDFIL